MKYHSSEVRGEERFKHELWCKKNGILIYAEGVPGNNKFCMIIVEINGSRKIGKEKYKHKKYAKEKDVKWWEKIWELRKYYYDKNNKQWD